MIVVDGKELVILLLGNLMGKDIPIYYCSHLVFPFNSIAIGIFDSLYCNISDFCSPAMLSASLPFFARLDVIE
ncbi:Uncharacterised protein [Segatella copri]|nr:Uncharacterised protein [Segatella copri]